MRRMFCGYSSDFLPPILFMIYFTSFYRGTLVTVGILNMFMLYSIAVPIILCRSGTREEIAEISESCLYPLPIMLSETWLTCSSIRLAG